ncbi:B-box zinc finger protein [Candidatus Oscillochloris fontis]|uniref:B-box zinc finger protein n=1 Tax=Candidatus Oscillochloris fontis TaxID=2496868 RepID=UPI00101B7C18|nr:B-box zinc finger protein [Candidatus Oscillochloris fontis]
MAECTTIGDAPVLVQEGRAALMAGDTYAARQSFRHALELNPNSVEALIGMAGTVRAYRDKRDYLLRALSIDPLHHEVRVALNQVEARLAAGEVLAPTGIGGNEPEPSAPSALLALPSDVGPILDVCVNHPNRETGLRCTSCDRPICADCVRPAAVGQLCPECARARRPVNYQVGASDLLINGAVTFFFAFLMSIVAGFGLALIGFFSIILAFILGPSAGELLVRLLERLNRKRGRSMQIMVGVCYGLGALPVVAFFFNIALLIFTIAALATAVTRLR